MEKLNRKLIMETLYENRENIRIFGIKKIILFGSYAKNKQKKDSDIDFLIEFKKGRGNFDDYIKLKHFLEDTFNKKIDLVEPEFVKKDLKSHIFEGETYEARV